MTLYTTETCPRCKVLKAKLEKANIPVSVSYDTTKLEQMGYRQVPMLELDNGQMLDFGQAIQFIAEVQR